MRRFVTAAHDLGMRVLFDYVPHGPCPEGRSPGRTRNGAASIARAGRS